jgi:small subunit ribosomal protein S7
MPRKGKITRRKVLPDPIYHSVMVTRLVNFIMLRGQRGTAQAILYNAFKRIEKATSKNPLEVFESAINNIQPILETRSKRVGGTNYQVPTQVNPNRKETLGLRWLVKYSRIRKEKTMEERLAKEILDAANNVGGAVKKKEDTHKMAEANKAFANMRG